MAQRRLWYGMVVVDITRHELAAVRRQLEPYRVHVVAWDVVPLTVLV